MKRDKKYFESKYKEIIRKLNTCKIEINEIDSKEKILNSIIQVYQSAIDDQKKTVKNELDHAINAVEWDKFVIAFFGETNAGKSTTIETFRIKLQEATRQERLKKDSSGVDGEIVGTGESDFTKDYNEYNMNVNGNPIVLIDVPGIEGNESEFKEGIQKALSKAHCVFYICRCNGQINEETTKKIKEYLGDWVSVYSVYNINGSVNSFEDEEDREALKGENEKKNEKLVEKTFKNVLGNVYKGNISIQAWLALCSIAKFSAKRPDLKKQQASLMEYFGSSDRLYQFSEFPKLMDVVEQKSHIYKDEIIEANRQKLQSVAHSSIQTLLYASESQSKEMADLEQHLRNFRFAVNREFSKAERNIESGCMKAYNSMFEYIKRRLFKHIENGDSSDKLKEKCDGICMVASNNFERDCKDVCQKQIKILTENIAKQQKELANYYKGMSTFNATNISDVNINIDFSETFDDLDIDLGDVVEFAMIFAALPFMWNPVGWIITGVSFVGWALGKLLGDGGKGEAKESVRKNLEEAKNKHRTEMSRNLQKLKDKLNQKSRDIQNSVKREEQNVNKLKLAIENSTIEIKQTINELSL